RTSQCNAMGVGHACRDRRSRPSYSTACVTSPLKTWLRNDSALLRIAGDSACKVDPVNRRTLNSINCVRGGRRYRLRAQGDFCAIAPRQMHFADASKHAQVGLRQGKEALRSVLMHLTAGIFLLRVIDILVEVARERPIAAGRVGQESAAPLHSDIGGLLHRLDG